MPCSLKPGRLELVPFSSIASLHANILALVSGGGFSSWVSISVSYDSLYSLIGCSNFGAGGLSCELILLQT